MGEQAVIIQGVVQTGDGEAVAGARIYFISGPGPLPDIAALTGNDGTFILSVPTTGEYVIGASAGETLTGKIRVRAAETPVEATITMKEGEL